MEVKALRRKKSCPGFYKITPGNGSVRRINAIIPIFENEKNLLTIVPIKCIIYILHTRVS